MNDINWENEKNKHSTNLRVRIISDMNNCLVKLERTHKVLVPQFMSRI